MTAVDTQTASLPAQGLSDKQRPARTCVLVLGMHRSGTSALTRILSLAGATLPVRLMPAGPGNESGHWEPLELVGCHDRFLEEIGSRWHDWQAADFSKLPPDRLSEFKAEIQAILTEDYPNGDIFVVKDPRICRFTKFFIETLEELGFKIALVHAFRNPLDVVNSLNSRKEAWPAGYTTTDAALLWLRHVLDVEMDCRGRQRALVSFDFLMQQPKETLASIESQTGLTFANSWAAIEPEVRTFLSPQQRHHAFKERDLDANPDTKGWVMQTFAALRALERNHQDAAATNTITKVAETFNDASAILGRVLAAARVQQQTELAARAAEVAHLRMELQEQAHKAKKAESDELGAADLKLQLAEAEGLNAALKEAFESAERQIQQQRAENLRHIREVEVERDLKAEENALLRRELAATHERYLGSMSWRVTRPLRIASRAPGSIKRALAVAPAAFRIGGSLGGTLRRTAGIFREEGIGGITKRITRLDPTDDAEPLNVPAVTLFAPLVSVIVPNYNHGPYLQRRLNSIYAQDYKNIEVILLDDKSTDNSAAILRSYRDRYPSMTTLVENTENSGSGYKQWEKGLALAKGDLIWIAESDDWSDPHFLSTLVPPFRDESILLSYCNSVFMNEEGSRAQWSTQEYLRDMDFTLWSREFTMSAHKLVQKAWSQKNIVVNVSSAVFRRPPAPYESSWRDMKICGDWLFYLNLIRGGRVHYTPRINNYYRMHTSNTSKAMFARDVYYKEHEEVANFAIDAFNSKTDFVDRQRKHLVDQWKRYRPNDDIAALDQLYSPSRIRARTATRPPAILMAGFAFAAGGGETFPIFLANMLRRHGYSVTFLNCDQAPRQEDMRRLLRNDIAVLNRMGRLKDIISDYGIDIIHSHHAWVDQSILDIVPAKSACKTVVTMHGMYEGMENPQRQTLVNRLIGRSNAIVYTASKNLAPFREGNLENHPKLHRIPNALEEVPYTPVPRAKLGIPEDAFVLCLVSRAIPQKGWEEAIASVDLARKRSGIDIRLVLIGTGPEEDRLRALHASTDFVQFLGFRRNLRDFYAMADMGFLPSRFPGESYPLTVIDCLATGKPVIVSAIAEIPSMIKAGNELAGCLFELEDWKIPVELLANRIIICAGDKDYYARMKAATAKAYAQFDPRVMMGRYVAVYNDICHRTS